MKVVVATSFPQDPTQPHGGVESVSVNLVRGLAKLDGLEIDVVTTSRACESAARSEWSGATIHRLPWEGRNVLTHVLGPGRRRVREYVTALEPDVIHAHDIYGLMLKQMSIPRVFTIHGFIHADTLEAGERFAWIRSRIWRRVEHAAWADQPHIISISPYVRERLSGIARGSIHDIDNPIAEAFFDVSRSEQRGTIFSAALICPRKNQLGLVEALGRLRDSGIDARLRLAGAVSDQAYAGRVMDRITALGVQEHVALLGSISSQQVSDELAAASAFALVSFEEGSPMGIEEAMAAGVPIVTSNRCGMPYMVRDGESGFLVDPHDPEDVARRLGQVLEDDALSAAMSEKCRRIAEDRFHPAVVARRTREVYLQACGDRMRSGRRD
ncbi:MAG: glycosyltransferase family 4 protein [Phycisphaerae bacterium]|nr:glycosyltransferase family 4 protein [Phycisphaerae bacterium]